MEFVYPLLSNTGSNMGLLLIGHPKPKKLFQITSETKVFAVEEQEVYLKLRKFKTATLFVLTIHIQRANRPKKLKHLHLGFENLQNAEIWKEAIVQQTKKIKEIDVAAAIQTEISTALSPESASSDSEESLSSIKLRLYNDTHTLSDSSLFRTNESKYRVLESTKGFQLLEEVENSGTFIIIAEVREHAHHVFEEFQLFSPGIPSSPLSVVNDSLIESVKFLDTSEANQDLVCVSFMKPTFWLGRRRVVLERMWRLENGIYTLYFHSAPHQDGGIGLISQLSRLLLPLSNLWRPLPLQVEGGITIHPASGVAAGNSCLVHYAVRFIKQGMAEWLPGCRILDRYWLLPFVSQVKRVQQTFEFSQYENGISALERIHALVRAHKAKEAAPKQLSFRGSILVMEAVNKFKSLLHKRASRVGVPIPSNVSCVMWYDPGPVNFHVRGDNYFEDHIKIPAKRPLMAFCALEIVECEPPRNVHMIDRRADHPLHFPKAKEGPFTLIINMMTGEGPPHLNFLFYFRPRNFEDFEKHTKFGQLWQKFMEGSKEERDTRMKLIPSVQDGGWLVKQLVGTTPVIIGKKLETHYFEGENYLEIDIDTNYSSTARKVIGKRAVAPPFIMSFKIPSAGMCLKATKSLMVDLAFTIEPHGKSELPERLLAVARLNKLDVTSAKKLKL
ncbi:uncharacterized protein LOC135145926 [Zophobas morio]|uniref:uncharacterized protein LOC135145926 n=1 Tax=Zophobas morio TaxID=2755281 RepID=UPI003082B988